VKVTVDDEEEKKKALLKKTLSLSGRRKGIDGRRGEADERLKEFSDADLAERNARLTQAAKYVHGVGQQMDRANRQGKQQIRGLPGQRGEPVEIEEPITPRSLSAALGLKVNDIIGKLMRQHRMMVGINQVMQPDVPPSWRSTSASTSTSSSRRRWRRSSSASSASANGRRRTWPRAPGRHDPRARRPRQDEPAGQDPQRQRRGGRGRRHHAAHAAWTVEVKGGDGQTKRVTFIDTPGHQAFTSMRARGANMTDVVVLVVAAVEGVMPQTIESINHARAAKVPIVVAMNKIDRPDANPDMVLGQLAAQGLNRSEWGGDIEVIRTSAHTGEGIPELIEILDYQSQLLELKADPTSRPRAPSSRPGSTRASVGGHRAGAGRDAEGRRRDPVRPGVRPDPRAAQRPRRADPGGRPEHPGDRQRHERRPDAGDKFYTVESLDRAREIAEEREMLVRRVQLAAKTQVTTAANLFDNMRAGDVKTINLIIKADVQGSVETLAKTVTDYNTEEVRIRVIHSAVGGITESDVELAAGHQGR
jgi:translation initiation factor IF-2